jgi:uncharacterized protein (DUF885 family)
MKAPRMLGNTGEQGEFVLPLSAPGATGAEAKPDDDTFAAASWTLTAHEARPGHELQFASMLEHGVSTARTVYAFNSVNVEGWGLYAESITLPFMPADGKLISLQNRLLRVARAFLDPELEEGKWTPDSALAFLEKEVCASPALARSEVDRYTFISPAQATSYFYGYTRLRELRKDVEAKLGAKFDAQKFHDFVLAQGLLPAPTEPPARGGDARLRRRVRPAHAGVSPEPHASAASPASSQSCSVAPRKSPVTPPTRAR